MFGGIVAIALLFLVIQASFLAVEGNVQDAATITPAALALVTFIYAGALVALFSTVTPNVPFLFTSSTEITKGARDFVIGFAFFFLISVFAVDNSIFQFAILNVTEGVFAQAASVLGSFPGFYLITVAAPVAEELLFFVALPGILLTFIIGISKIKPFSFLGNPFLQTGIVIAVVAPIFAAFHVGQAGLMAFFISAMIFRGIILAIGTDVRNDFIPFLSAGVLFAIGGHMANNIQATGGILNFVNVMAFGATNLFETISGILVLVTLGVIGLVFVLGVFSGEVFKRG